MKIYVEKLTDERLLQKACASTRGAYESKATLRALYRSEHSPIRTQLFWIEMEGIPSFVSVHLVRHKHGVEHFVQSMRGESGPVTRETPVLHSMLINAQALINMSRKRLCAKADPKTVSVWQEVCKWVSEADPELAPFLVPECVYRGGVCHELKPCVRN